MFKEKDILEVILPPLGGKVKRGAYAFVVDKDHFPDLTKMIESAVPDNADRLDFICIEWMKGDPRWKGQEDGFYHKYRFKKVMSLSKDN